MPRELLFSLTRKDFLIEAKCAGGNGGQNRNRRRTACRIRHEPSGAEGYSCDQREYKQNERAAFERLIERLEFKNWHKMEVARRCGILADIDDRVAQEMKKIRVDIKDSNGRWVEENGTTAR